MVSGGCASAHKGGLAPSITICSPCSVLAPPRAGSSGWLEDPLHVLYVNVYSQGLSLLLLQLGLEIPITVCNTLVTMNSTQGSGRQMLPNHHHWQPWETLRSLPVRNVQPSPLPSASAITPRPSVEAPGSCLSHMLPEHPTSHPAPSFETTGSHARRPHLCVETFIPWSLQGTKWPSLTHCPGVAASAAC